VLDGRVVAKGAVMLMVVPRDKFFVTMPGRV
jgi:hypothetical protein